MELHKVKLAKGHKLIDAISQCVDFVHGKYAVRPTIIKHNNIDMIRDVAFSSLTESVIKKASVQKLYGMDVKRSTKCTKNSVILSVVRDSKELDVVKITV